MRHAISVEGSRFNGDNIKKEKPMSKFSTHCMDKMEKHVNHALTGDSQPKKSTLDFLRQFARVYQAEPMLQPGLCGFVLN